ALLLPVVWVVLGRSGLPVVRRALYTGVPLLLLALYTLTNPLALASMVSLSGGAHPELADRLLSVLRLWVVGGSLILSVLGTAGLVLRPRWSVILSFLLLCAYVFLSPADYYAILFLPLLTAGFVL